MKYNEILLSILLLFILIGCTKKETENKNNNLMEQVRKYSFAANPELNPQTTFEINHYEIDKIQEILETQVLLVKDIHDGQAFIGTLFFYRNNTLTPFAGTAGRHGLLSGLVYEKSFYYTYSWGTEEHRSHIGRAMIIDDKVVFQTTDQYVNQYIFVKLASDNRIEVVSGKYINLNNWTEEMIIGEIDLTEESQIVIKNLK